MINCRLPIRIDLKVDEFTSCSFTISDVPFSVPPHIGDVVGLHHDTWAERELVNVVAVYHEARVTSAETMLVCTMVCKDSDHLTTVFDKFRAAYTLSDVVSSIQPPAYYSAYRAIAKIWGRNIFDVNDSPMAFAELVRGAIMASPEFDETTALQSAVEEIHHTIISLKRYGVVAINLIEIIKSWDAKVGLARVIAAAADDAILTCVIRIYSGLRSVPRSSWPEVLQKAIPE